MDGAELRAVVLGIIEDLSREYTYLQSGAVLQRAQKSLGLTNWKMNRRCLHFSMIYFVSGTCPGATTCLIRLRQTSTSLTSAVRRSRSIVEIQPIRMGISLIYALSPVFCPLPNRT